jgi:DNA repair exonuclease SbcCD ATPase subunit
MSKTTFTDRRNQDEGPDEALARRRDKVKDSRATAETLRQRVDELDAEAEANAARSRDYEKALQKAKAEVAELTKALKRTARQQESLLSRRSAAVKSALKAKDKAQKIEAKYDQSVLSEIVRREKLADLGSGGSGGSAAPAGSNAGASQAPEPEHADLGTATATEVAARKTADRS